MLTARTALRQGSICNSARLAPETWTLVSDATSPYLLVHLTAGAAFDVQVQSLNAAGASEWSASSTLSTRSASDVPYAPAITSVAPPPDGTNSVLSVAWTAPTTDSSHPAAVSYNVRYSPSGAGTWTTISGVSSPCRMSGLSGAVAIDVQVQGANVSGNAGAWSGTTTGKTWGATVAAGNLAVATTQVHNTGVSPGGGANFVATPAPTSVTGAAFAWSASASNSADDRPDRDQWRRPDQWVGAVLQCTVNRRHLLSLDARARRRQQHDRRPGVVRDHRDIARRNRLEELGRQSNLSSRASAAS